MATPSVGIVAPDCPGTRTETIIIIEQPAESKTNIYTTTLLQYLKYIDRPGSLYPVIPHCTVPRMLNYL